MSQKIKILERNICNIAEYMLSYQYCVGRRDGIGRRAGLKILWWRHRMGSTPSPAPIILAVLLLLRRKLEYATTYKLSSFIDTYHCDVFPDDKTPEKEGQTDSRDEEQPSGGRRDRHHRRNLRKIVKTKDETIVIQVGADKVKFEMMRWSVSTVTTPSNRTCKDRRSCRGRRS